MSKITLAFSGPVTTRSGYGAHARDLLKSLKDMGKYDIHVHSTRWGDTPMNALDEDNEFHQWINDKTITGTLPKQPDIWMQVTVPNEFQRVGKFNIGVTAGIESTAVSHEFIEGMNRMDLNIVPSVFSKDVFDRTVYSKKDDRGNQIGELKVEKPIEVLFEGFDIDTYNDKVEMSSENLKNELNKIDEDFCFLFVGHWLQGNFGHDRKDIATLIKTFGEAFKNKSDKPALVLKTSSATFSVMDRQDMMNRIEQIKEMVGKNCPSIYLIHGDLTDDEMAQLYNNDKMKAMVSFTKGEGFGRPLLEFSVTGKPVMASDFSGHLDFLDRKYATLLPGQVSKVHESARNNMLIEGSSWFYVDYNAAKDALRDLYKNYKKYKKKSQKLGEINRNTFTLDDMTEEFAEILEEYTPKFATEVNFNLPNLPSLKKVEK